MRMCMCSFVKFVAVVAHPFNELLDENVFLKAVHQEPDVGVSV